MLQVMRKSDLIRKNMVQSVKNERNILAMANNPFVVRCFRRSHCCGGCTGFDSTIDLAADASNLLPTSNCVQSRPADEASDQLC